LIQATKAKDAALGAALEREFRALSSRRSFGLNFERHRPEAVELPQRPVRKGDKVRILPPRGSTEKGDQRLWRVTRIEEADEGRVAHLGLIGGDTETTTASVEDLVVVAEFRDPIYPGLVSTGKVERGGDKPFHTVINAENYHALKALTFTHKGKVDAIYIDPPYNTGAKDWKYNNDYVEGDDLYRHSKWLAFMERRLLLARDLLNPDDSVLIVSIDEKEYLRIGLLLEQIFPDARIQMVSSVINPGGSTRPREFGRVDEYLYFVFLGDASVRPGIDDMLSPPSDRPPPVEWHKLIRHGGESCYRQARPGLFYPIFLDTSSGRISGIGDPLDLQQDRKEIADPPGQIAIWPLFTDGREATWQLSPPALREAVANGYVRTGKMRLEERWCTIYYLKSGKVRQIQSGEITVLGRDAQGAVQVEYAGGQKRSHPKTVWNRPTHNAAIHGSSLLRALLPGRRFPYPKALYAVEDSLRFFVGSKPDAVVLDFFAGSGTTAHAVMRLNHADGGVRQSISVTNNEVSPDEQRALRRRGLRPGDDEWESLGICDFITKPRLRTATSGLTPEGEPVKGEYKQPDPFPMADGFEENAEFFTLTYESPVGVAHNRAFERIAPLLWLRAGARGARIDEVPAEGWAVADAYGVLFDLDQAKPFCDAVVAAGAGVAFVVTDDERRFQSVVRRLPEGVEPVRLYESYLSNFRFVSGE
jgi:adenine-specific DNA-methyltransferase